MTLSLFRFAIITLIAFPLFISPAHAASTIVDVPGVHVEADDSGATVIVPGVSVNAPNDVVAPTVSTSSYVNAQLNGMDFSNQNLAGADFTNAELTNTNFANANLTGAKFVNATLSGANLTNANFSGTDMTNATVDHAIAVNTRFDGAILTNVDMSLLVRQVAPRPTFVNSAAISSALRIDPAHPKTPRRLDLTVNFDFGSDKLTVDGAKQVREIAAALADPTLQQAHIVVEGHTDNVGTDAYNLGLSNRRADRVMQTLVTSYAIPTTTLSARGFGKSRPIATNDTDLGRAMNRRVTLVNVGG